MGDRDYYDWDSKRVGGCGCSYCGMRLHFCAEMEMIPNATNTGFHLVRTGHELPDGEVQVYGGTSTKCTWVKTLRGSDIGCMKKLGTEPNLHTASRASLDKSGCVCTRCNSRNEYAVPNQSDGKSYVCFECR